MWIQLAILRGSCFVLEKAYPLKFRMGEVGCIQSRIYFCQRLSQLFLLPPRMHLSKPLQRLDILPLFISAITLTNRINTSIKCSR